MHCYWTLNIQILIGQNTTSLSIVWDMVFDASFNNMSVISLQSVLLVEEALDENHRPVASHWQTFSHKVVSSTQTDWMGSCKSNHVTIKTTNNLNLNYKYLIPSIRSTCLTKWQQSQCTMGNMSYGNPPILAKKNPDIRHSALQSVLRTLYNCYGDLTYIKHSCLHIFPLKICEPISISIKTLTHS
jgi:hypothetical protein